MPAACMARFCWFSNAPYSNGASASVAARPTPSMAVLLLVMPDPLNMDVAAGIALPKMLSRTPCILPNPVPPMIPIRVDRAASIPGAPPPARSRMACIAPVVVDPKPGTRISAADRAAASMACGDIPPSGLYALAADPDPEPPDDGCPMPGKLLNPPSPRPP